MLSFCYNCSKKLEIFLRLSIIITLVPKQHSYKCKSFETLPDKITINFKILFLSNM